VETLSVGQNSGNLCYTGRTKKFEKHSFSNTDKHGLIGSFLDENSIRNDSNVEISYSKLEPGFTAAPHIHTQTKTIVIILSGGMTFSLDGELVEVDQGEYIVFEKGVVEAVVAVKLNTENLTIHAPSIVGGDKKDA
jgi:quercetin dioxygenase-like cupin family protein